MKTYRSVINPPKTITVAPDKAARFDMSDSWEDIDAEPSADKEADYIDREGD